jgi:glucokinase
LLRESRAFSDVKVVECNDYGDLQSAITSYLSACGLGATDLQASCLAVPGTVDGDFVKIVNNNWSFRLSTLEAFFGREPLVINDFTAQAMALDSVQEKELHYLGRPRANGKGTRVVLGPGTGLGVASILPSGEILPSEGGHISFAATTEHQLALKQQLMQRFAWVSAEDCLSGKGLENLYQANAVLQGQRTQLTAAEIAARANEGDALALLAVADFLDILAATAGDMALAFWSEGGVYLSGGVLQKLKNFIDPDRFRQFFENKGPVADFCRRVPVAIVAADYPGLKGCAHALQAFPTSN